jgi:hypothetical protein
MVWKHLTTKPGRTKGWSGHRECRITEARQGSEEEEEEEEEEQE